MEPPIKYFPNWLAKPDELFDILWKEEPWVRIDKVPRRECYHNVFNEPYSYGVKDFARTYQPSPFHPVVNNMMDKLEAETQTKFEVCFLNGYEDGSDQLGWHADDSPEMDDARPIAIISLGAEREIWFCPKEDRKDVTKLKLGNGSLCLMLPGMQDTWNHRIPKSGEYHCGPRISLTFRGFVYP